MPNKDKYKGKGGRLWNAFLHSIEDHGGWTSVNDANAVEADFSEALDRVEKRKRARKEKSAKARATRLGAAQPVTPAFLASVEAERDIRGRVLLDLRQKPHARRHLPHISRLPPEGCQRTADVWAARTILARAGQRVTGRLIAEYLIRNGRDHGARPSTLATWVYKDLERIEKLEREHAGVTIWQPFKGNH